MTEAISGFVLVGGQSRRMGQDKALLGYHGLPLADWIARHVLEATGNVTLLGDAELYAPLGWPVLEDIHRGCGPIGGLHAALTSIQTGYCLLTACDLPNLDAPFLRLLIAQAQAANHLCVAAREDSGAVQPLCALYHRDSLPIVEQAICEKQYRMRTLAARLNAVGVPASPDLIRNVNTPEQWHEHLAEKKART